MANFLWNIKSGTKKLNFYNIMANENLLANVNVNEAIYCV